MDIQSKTPDRGNQRKDSEILLLILEFLLQILKHLDLPAPEVSQMPPVPAASSCTPSPTPVSSPASEPPTPPVAEQLPTPVLPSDTSASAFDKAPPTPEEVRQHFVSAAKAGHAEEVKAILAKHGAAKISDVPSSEYSLLIEEIKDIFPQGGNFHE